MSKKEFYDSKVDKDRIVVSNKIIGNNDTSKVFIDYLVDISGVVKPLCLILPQMSGWIKYFENGGKNASLKIADDEVYIKYNQIWNKIKGLLGVKFYSEPIYDDSYNKTKIKTFSHIIKTLLMEIKYQKKE